MEGQGEHDACFFCENIFVGFKDWWEADMLRTWAMVLSKQCLSMQEATWNDINKARGMLF